MTLGEAQAADRVAGEREREMRERIQAEVGNFVEEYVSAMRGETVRFCDLLSARINPDVHRGSRMRTSRRSSRPGRSNTSASTWTGSGGSIPMYIGTGGVP